MGVWSNFEDLEESLSINELLAILKTINKEKYEEVKIHAALQGVDLDNNSQGGNGGGVDFNKLVQEKQQEMAQHRMKKVQAERKASGEPVSEQFIADDAAELASIQGLEIASGW